MSTVASRVVRSSPHRNTSDTWAFIVDLLTQGKDGDARKELLSVSGIASSIIAERGAKGAAIVVTCDGPRTRVYCLYDEAAIEGGDAKEEELGPRSHASAWRSGQSTEASVGFHPSTTVHQQPNPLSVRALRNDDDQRNPVNRAVGEQCRRVPKR